MVNSVSAVTRMSNSKTNIQLDYTIPVTFQRSPDGKTLLIQGIVIDYTVNENSWQVLAEELPYFVAVSQNVASQLSPQLNGSQRH